MTLKEIAIRNLIRRKGKAAFVLAGLLIGVATIVAVTGFAESMTADINHKLEKYGANILIVPRTENLTLTYGGLSLGGVSFEVEEIRETELNKVFQIKNAANIAALGPLVLGVIRVATRRVLLAGVDFEASRLLKPWWKINGVLPAADGLIAGAEAARILKVAAGDRIRVGERDLLVTGILDHTGSQDDHLVFSRLATAQKLLGKTGRISMAEVAALCGDCPIDDMVRQIAAAIPGAKVMAIQQVVKGRMTTLAQFRKFSFGLSVVIMLVGSLVVLVTMMGSVRERTREIGIFRAIGFKRRHIIQIIFIEAGLISGVAGVLGYLLGYGATGLALRFFAASRDVPLPLDLKLAGAAVVLAVFMGLASSVYPAAMASRMDPNEALKAL